MCVLGAYNPLLINTDENWNAGNLGYYYWSSWDIHPHTGRSRRRTRPAAYPGLGLAVLDVERRLRGVLLAARAPFAHGMGKFSLPTSPSWTGM